jgi:hypothetical protein
MTKIVAFMKGREPEDRAADRSQYSCCEEALSIRRQEDGTCDGLCNFRRGTLGGRDSEGDRQETSCEQVMYEMISVL